MIMPPSPEALMLILPRSVCFKVFMFWVNAKAVQFEVSCFIQCNPLSCPRKDIHHKNHDLVKEKNEVQNKLKQNTPNQLTSIFTGRSSHIAHATPNPFTFRFIFKNV